MFTVANDFTNAISENSIEDRFFKNGTKNGTQIAETINQQTPPAVTNVINRIETLIIKILDILYNFLNSGTNFDFIDNVTKALFRLSNSQGFYGALNYLFVASNFAQTYGGIIAGIALKDTKKSREEDSISAMEVSDRLQSSIDDLNDRLTYGTDFLSKFIYCRYVNAASGNAGKVRRVSKEICSRHLQELENHVLNYK